MLRGASKLAKYSQRGAKDVAFGLNARTEMLAGVNKLADAVSTTMGPKGKKFDFFQFFYLIFRFDCHYRKVMGCAVNHQGRCLSRQGGRVARQAPEHWRQARPGRG